MSHENENFDFDRAYRIVAVDFKVGESIVQSSRETRGKFGASGVGVARDRVEAVRNRLFFPSV